MGRIFFLLSIEPTYDRPVRFSGVEYIRIGESVKKLAEHPQHERALWLATGRRKFEDAVAMPNRSFQELVELLDIDSLYKLSGDPRPKNDQSVVRKLCNDGFIIDNMQGGFDITNLGACLLAKEIEQFSHLRSKAVRVVRYKGKDKRSSDTEQEGARGYAVGFTGMIRFIMQSLPSEEVYIDGVRRIISAYPETAIREVIANALIHQDFKITGSGPVVEIYSDRVEVSNPGNSLIEPDRMLDERRSRNEKLASAMRALYQRASDVTRMGFPSLI